MSISNPGNARSAPAWHRTLLDRALGFIGLLLIGLIGAAADWVADEEPDARRASLTRRLALKAISLVRQIGRLRASVNGATDEAIARGPTVARPSGDTRDQVGSQGGSEGTSSRRTFPSPSIASVSIRRADACTTPPVRSR